MRLGKRNFPDLGNKMLSRPSGKTIYIIAHYLEKSEIFGLLICVLIRVCVCKCGFLVTPQADKMQHETVTDITDKMTFTSQSTKTEMPSDKSH